MTTSTDGVPRLRFALRAIWRTQVVPDPIFYLLCSAAIALSIVDITVNLHPDSARALVHGIRYAGTALEFMALVFAARAIVGARKLFGRAPLMMVFRQWLRNVRTALTPRHLRMHALTGEAMLTATGIVTPKLIPGPDTPLPERIRMLECNLNQLWKRSDDYAKTTSDELSKLKDAVARESTERRGGLDGLAERVDKFAVGDLYLAIVAWIWLLLGGIATNIPDEIATALRWFWDLL